MEGPLQLPVLLQNKFHHTTAMEPASSELLSPGQWLLGDATSLNWYFIDNPIA
jgi:hypothetical protein